MKYPMKCPECGEPVKKARPKGYAKYLTVGAVDARRLEASHLDREPLCPVMTSTGYQPAMPVRS